MVRTIGGFAVLAFMAMIGLKVLAGVFGMLWGLVLTLLWWAFIGFVVYTLLKIFAPGLAARIRSTIRGTPVAHGLVACVTAVCCRAPSRNAGEGSARHPAGPGR